MKIEIYRRKDNKYAWRLIARNGQIIATDGGQGFENHEDCADSAALATGRQTRTDVALDVFTLPSAF